MRRTLVTSTLLALALSGALATTAAAQNPFVIEGTIPDAGTLIQDEHNATKELGPKNASNTKIGPINTAPVPMLDTTNPNNSVDLDKVYLSTKYAVNLDAWVYFAWTRDSVNGSGFVSLEANVTASGCDYTSNATLLGCNPWAHRANGDFLISWDQQGNSHDIYLRVFQSPNWVTPASCAPANVTPLGCKLDSNQAEAAYTPTFDGGELAVNLVASGLATNGACTTFANVIPGTVTGNSDTADYKDVVLKALSIQTCGAIKVIKKTQPAGLTGTYPYTIANGGATIFNTADSECTTSGADKTKCQGTLTSDGDSDTIDNVIAGTTYTLVEGSPGAGYSTPSISCVVGTDTANPYPGTAFTVTVSETTTCTITNTFVAQPTAATVQGATTRLTDSVTITGILRTTGDAANFKVDFKLYSSNTCSAASEVGSAAEKAANTDIAVSFDNASDTSGTATTGSSILVTNGTYYWRAFFKVGSNAYNNPAATSCGGEVTTVSVTHTGSGS
jgi:hypothetical protein